MFAKTKPEVLVVGAGPVGLFAALALAKRGVRVEIADKEWRTGAHSYALALHPHSLELLDRVGLRDEVLQSAYRVSTVGFYEGTSRRAQIEIGGPEDKSSCLAVLRQDSFERLLENALNRLGVKVLWNHEVSQLISRDTGTLVRIDTLEKDTVGYAVAHTEWIVAKSTQLQVPFLIGADGHRSLARRSLGLDFAPIGEAEHFAVFEFESDASLEHEMRVVLGQRTTDALWPLPDGYCRWSFQLEDYTAPEATRMKDRLAVQLGGAQFPVLSEERLHALIAERAPWFEGNVGRINWRIVVRFERRMASGFGNKRVWLAGDAAHMTGPVGMQSMNVGLCEASQLAGIMAGILREGASGEPLEAYNRQQVARWRLLLGIEGGLEPEAGADPWICQRSNRLLSCIPASDDELARLAQQVGLRVV